MGNRFHRPPRILRRCLVPALLAVSAFATAAGNDLPAAVDLRAEAARAKRAGGPLIVVFSRAECRYCETVKRDYLKPLEKNPNFNGVVIRQINQDSDAAMTDFRGKKTTQASFASAEKISLVPVVAFYGPNGKTLADPLVGAGLPDFYQSYLEDAIAKSTAALKAR
ncbi:MAG: thioredoxin family protein [Chromatiaceae bacterium]|nr:thioredoxin family protein [Candidatus Thioaporhodococcus sediminis]